MLSIKRQISNYNHSTRNEKIKYIVVHDVGEISSAQNNADYFCGGNRNASADFFVDSNSIIQIVDYHNNYSWAIGDGRGKYGKTNSNSVSIEMCLESNHQPSEATINNTLDLVRYLMDDLSISIDNVVTHHMCSDKNCPQSFSANNWEKWNWFKSKLVGETSTVSYQQPQPQENPIEKAKKFVGQRCKELQEKLIKCGYNCGGYGADGDFGGGTYESLLKFQKDNGLVADGLAGDKTFEKLDSIISEMNKPKMQINQKVLAYQKAFNKMGLGRLDEDGILGNMTLGSISKLSLLKVGSNNAMVGWIQGVLGCTQDNIYGNITKSKVVSYQQNHGLSADGIAGQQTIKSMLVN
jgi:N-acetylmuramoyl-L-alanine amidase